MQKPYEAPELTLIGEADEVILGAVGGGNDCDFFVAPDFEFEQD
jgi:hypothetical protein